MISELTDAQTALFDEYREKWLSIGLSTKPTDVDKALSALEKVYSGTGYKLPSKVETYASPFEAITEMKLRYDFNITVDDFAYGLHSASWLSLYDYFINVVKIDQIELHVALEGLIELSQCCGWVLLFDNLVVLTDPPSEIRFDDQDRTHCEDGLAITYSDGTGIAIWHGNRIPKEWIFDRSTITPDVMLHWKNIEERRSACEIIGWVAAIKLMNGVVIDKDVDETVGTLMEVDIPDIGKERFLIVLDPNTDKPVGLPVPPEMVTALEANSWTYGIDKINFKPEFRT